jgi:hypothetical protein
VRELEKEHPRIVHYPIERILHYLAPQISRRLFLKLFLLGIGGAFGWKAIRKHTEAMYAQQNREILFRLLMQPQIPEPHFGIITDPRRQLVETLNRVRAIREGVGQVKHVGVFTRIEDFKNKHKAQSYLTQFEAINIEGAIPFIALGGGDPVGDKKNGSNILAPQNAPLLDSYLDHFAQTLVQYGKPVVVRFLYEMNTPSFGYSKNVLGLHAKDQIAGFGRAAIEMDRVLKEKGIRELVSLMFNPTFESSFKEYATDKQVVDVFDVFGMDMYDFSVMPGFYVGDVFLPPGKLSPFGAITGPITDLVRIANGKPVVMAEFASLIHDNAWIQQMVLLLLANNIGTISYFDSDERDKNIIREGDFRLTRETMNMLRAVYALIQVLSQAIHTDSDKQLINDYLGFLRIPSSYAEMQRLRA